MRIPHVQDDDTFRSGLKESGFAVDGACNATEAMQMASENWYDVILRDIGMPGPWLSVAQSTRLRPPPFAFHLYSI